MQSEIKDPKSKIIILSQYYPPEHGAPQNRLHDLAKRMKQAGCDITIMTAMPNYPKGEVFPEYRGRIVHEEKIDGIRVVRTWILPSKKKSTVRQLLCYFSFAFSSAFFGLFKLRRADLLVCESPPLFLGATALFLSFAKSARLIMNISDLWPESAVQLGMLRPGPSLSALEWFEKLLYRKSALVLCQTDGIVGGVKKRHPEARTFLLPNGVDLEMFNRQPRDANFAREHGIPEGAFVVGYAGNHGRSQALSQLLDTAKILQDEQKKAENASKKDRQPPTGMMEGCAPATRSNPQASDSQVNIISKGVFTLFGDGPEKAELEKKAAEMGLENVKFFDSVPREQMPELLSQFDLAVVPLKDIDLFDGARPSKIFELMSVQVPFIFCGRGEGAEIAEKSGGAVVVPPEKPEELAEAVLGFAKFAEGKRLEMGKNARRFVETHYDRAKIAESFLSEIGKIG